MASCQAWNVGAGLDNGPGFDIGNECAVTFRLELHKAQFADVTRIRRRDLHRHESGRHVGKRHEGTAEGGDIADPPDEIHAVVEGDGPRSDAGPRSPIELNGAEAISGRMGGDAGPEQSQAASGFYGNPLYLIQRLTQARDFHLFRGVELHELVALGFQMLDILLGLFGELGIEGFGGAQPVSQDDSQMTEGTGGNPDDFREIVGPAQISLGSE